MIFLTIFLFFKEKANIMKVGLCCIGRLENRYILEYVKYYKKIGVDTIFLYDNNYKGEEHFEDVIGSYIDEGFVEIIDYRGKSYCQLSAYQDCYNKHGKDYDWVCFFDIDEYLVFADDGMNIKEFLSNKVFDEYDMIHINWKIYDDNGLVYYENKPLMERFKEPRMPLDFRYGYKFPENNHIKSIVKGGLDTVRWDATPHTPRNVKSCCDCIGNECKANSPFNPYNFDVAWLNHYQTKTIQEWMENKVKRGFPDGNKNKFLKCDPIAEFFGRNKNTKEKDNYIKSMEKKDKKMVIVSMTTIPKRKDRLMDNLPALLNQSYKFDKLIINIDDNLSDEDYKWYDALLEKDSRIEINKAEAKWRSCNKLLPTLKKYPEDIIITLDDDIFYPEDTVKELVEWHEKEPECIISHEINPLNIKDDYVSYDNAYDVMLMQKEWGKYFSNCALFPPHVFDGTDLYDYDKMMECTNGTHDELWFWVQSTLNGVQCIGLNYVRSFAPEMLRQYEEGEYQLTTLNNSASKIDSYMKKINAMYGKRLLENIKAKPCVFTITKDNIYTFLFLLPYVKKWYKGAQIEIKGLTKDWKNKLFKVMSGKEYLHI